MVANPQNCEISKKNPPSKYFRLYSPKILEALYACTMLDALLSIINYSIANTL